MDNRIEKTERLLKTGDRKYVIELDSLKEARNLLNAGKAHLLDMTTLPVDLPLLSTKPVLYVLNVDEEAILDPSLIADVTKEVKAIAMKAEQRCPYYFCFTRTRVDQFTPRGC